MTLLKSPTPEHKLINTISYFSFFEYPPSLEEIFTFFPEKITKKALKTLLERLFKQKKLIKSPIMSSRAPMGSLRDESRDLLSSQEIAPLASLGRNDKLYCQNNLNKKLFTFNFSLLTFSMVGLHSFPPLAIIFVQAFT